MQLQHEHPWSVSPREARAIQADLACHVERRDRLGTVRTVAGVDVGLPRGGKQVRAAVVVLQADSLAERSRAVTLTPLQFPYVPGLLSFRELPGVLSALEALPALPDLLLCDGHGYAPPRRFGLACHLGVLLDRPTIGVAKSRFIGTHAPVGRERGSRQPLMDGEETIGAVLRTRSGVSPLHVSCGHRVSLDTACEWVLRLAPRYRLPETTRRADAVASARGWA